MPPGTTRMQRPQGTPKQERPSAPKPEISEDRSDKRKKAVIEGLDILMMPLAGKAAMDQMQLEEGQVSVYALDLEVAHGYKEPFADITVKLAEEFPVIGVFLDKFSQGGPALTALMMVITFGAQIAENHNKLPEQMKKVLPVIAREDVAKSVLGQADKRQSSNGNGA